MFTISTTYLEYNNLLYKILRVIREHNRPIVDDWKEHLSADLVLKKNGIFYFLQKIEDVVEEEVKLDQIIES